MIIVESSNFLGFPSGLVLSKFKSPSKPIISFNKKDKDLIDRFVAEITKLCEIDRRLKVNILKNRRDIILAVEIKEKEIIRNILEKVGSVYTMNTFKVNEKFVYNSLR